MKVLIAEDDPVTRNLLSQQIRKLGHEVVSAADGRSAWDLYRAGSPQVLVSDWIMPGIDGPELCRWVRSDNRPLYTYIIMTTILGGKGCYLEGLQAGADDFLTKPVDFDVLSARLRVAQRVLSLQKEVKRLQELLPICSYCRRVRSESWLWQRIEEYISTHTDSRFSHSICPDCYEREVRPELEASVGG
ncbi:MAG: response regulator [Deltaproteobacteria bacterium]|nr:response regulator [Deltaproteobacteria bacterium]